MLWKTPTPAGGYFLKINNKQPTIPPDHKLLLFQCWIISAKVLIISSKSVHLGIWALMALPLLVCKNFSKREIDTNHRYHSIHACKDLKQYN